MLDANASFFQGAPIPNDWQAQMDNAVQQVAQLSQRLADTERAKRDAETVLRTREAQMHSTQEQMQQQQLGHEQLISQSQSLIQARDDDLAAKARELSAARKQTEDLKNAGAAAIFKISRFRPPEILNLEFLILKMQILLQFSMFQGFAPRNLEV